MSAVPEPTIRKLTSELTCPHCSRQHTEIMPQDACIFFFECQGCGAMLKPKAGDCCVPIALGASTGLLISSPRIVAAVWAVAFAWMGIGCLLNARRCHRLHCYISAPILLLGAVAVGLLGLGAINLGPHGLNNMISITLVLALFSFVPEVFWGRYRRR